jgi:plasmid stabilization system protein ParE
MAFKIIWSEQARDDLQSIVLFIAEDNPPVAESFGCLLMSKVDVLAQFPQL